MAAKRCHDERGSTTVMVVIFAVALLMMGGFVIDFGYALAAKREAMNAAEQAARVGADDLSQVSLRNGQTVVSDHAAAAAQNYLSSIGATGTATVNGGEVTVRVTKSSPTAILSAFGIGSLPVEATASALSIDENTP